MDATGGTVVPSQCTPLAQSDLAEVNASNKRKREGLSDDEVALLEANDEKKAHIQQLKADDEEAEKEHYTNSCDIIKAKQVLKGAMLQVVEQYHYITTEHVNATKRKKQKLQTKQDAEEALEDAKKAATSEPVKTIEPDLRTTTASLIFEENQNRREDQYASDTEAAQTWCCIELMKMFQTLTKTEKPQRRSFSLCYEEKRSITKPQTTPELEIFTKKKNALNQ